MIGRIVKYVLGLLLSAVVALLVWNNYIGTTIKQIQSPDGKHKIRIAAVGINGGTQLRLSTQSGWPLYSKFFHWGVRDGVPFAFEWFPDAVAMIDHFDLGTSVSSLALSNGQPLEFLSDRETEIREALRWKYNFSDYRKMTLERQDKATGGVLRVYTNEQTEGSLSGKPVWFQTFVVLFKFPDAAARSEAVLSTSSLEAIGKACNDPYKFRSVRASFGNDSFHSLYFTCHKPRTI